MSDWEWAAQNDLPVRGASFFEPPTSSAPARCEHCLRPLDPGGRCHGCAPFIGEPWPVGGRMVPETVSPVRRSWWRVVEWLVFGVALIVVVVAVVFGDVS